MNYPENIIQDINTAIADIAYVYTMPDRDLNDKAPKVFRTKFTPWSAAPFNRPFPGISAPDCDPESLYVEPVFMSPPLPHHELADATKIETSALHRYLFPLREVQTYYEKDFNWLEAYLRAVGYMESRQLLSKMTTPAN